MKRFVLFLTIISLASLPCKAQTKKEKTFVGRQIEWAKDYLDKSCIEGCDTAYVGLPKNGFFGSLSANFAGINTKVIGRGLLNFGDMDIKMNSLLQGQATVKLGYRGLLVSYTKDLQKAFNSDLSFSYFDRAWGAEFRNHSTNAMHGTVELPVLDEPIKVAKGNINVKTTFLDFYVILNSRKFSFSATKSPTVIQKHSAGSLLIVGSYMHSKLQNVSPSFVDNLDDVTEIYVVQAAVGIGYGYNYSIKGGKILLHLSAMPTVIIHNNNLVGWNYTTEDENGEKDTMHVLEKVTSKHDISFASIFRCSVNYNISDRFVVRADGKVNNLRFHSNSGLKIKTADWYCSVMFGVRF